MLQISNLTKRMPEYKRIKDTPSEKLPQHNGSFKINDISFHLPPGYIMGLVGLNGAGKSSLIKMILNIYHPDCGEIIIGGYSLKTDEYLAKELVGSVLDEKFYPEYMSLKDCGNFLGGFYNHFENNTYKKYCDDFNLDCSLRIKDLSKGQYMKFQLAFALSHQAKLFVMDEPTSSLDHDFHNEFMDIITDIVSDGEHSVLLSTHLTDDLDRIGDYITLIDNGNLILSDTMENLYHAYRITKGPDYLIRQIPDNVYIHAIHEAHSGSALIQNKKYSGIPDGLSLSEPTLEEIMYYMTKGGLIG